MSAAAVKLVFASCAMASSSSSLRLLADFAALILWPWNSLGTLVQASARDVSKLAIGVVQIGKRQRVSSGNNKDGVYSGVACFADT